MALFPLSSPALCPDFYQLPHRVVSLVGGGGKSTLMYHLAQTLSAQGKRVLVTTTTRIYQPRADLYAETEAAVRSRWAKGQFAVIGTREPETGKLSQPESSLLNGLIPQADLVLVEADGAKHHPIKVPREGEPVLLPQCDLVIALMGLSAIGKPLKECCFRLKEATALLGVSENHILTPADAAYLLSAPQGGHKDVGDREFRVVLSQWEDEKIGNAVAAALADRGSFPIYGAAFSPAECRRYGAMAQENDKEGFR